MHHIALIGLGRQGGPLDSAVQKIGELGWDTPIVQTMYVALRPFKVEHSAPNTYVNGLYLPEGSGAGGGVA